MFNGESQVTPLSRTACIGDAGEPECEEEFGCVESHASVAPDWAEISAMGKVWGVLLKSPSCIYSSDMLSCLKICSPQ